MRVRINIPAWGAREIAAGARALLGGARGESRERLRLALEAEAGGWHVHLVSSARYALALALRALDLEGKRVAVPAYVCPAVLTGLRGARAEAVPVDCAPSSLGYEIGALERAVATGDVDAVLAPNSYGVDQDFDAISRLGLPVVEDAAYQLGRSGADGRACGTRGDAGVWSFNFKALTAVGGGVLLLPTGVAPPAAFGGATAGAGDALRFANYALRAVAREAIPSFLPGAEPPARERAREARAALEAMRDAPMSELQAAVALAQWEGREAITARQCENAAAIARAVAESAALRPLARASDAIVHLTPILAPSPTAAGKIRFALYARGIQTEEPYPLLWNAPERFPNARDLVERLLLVPSNASLSESRIGEIARALADSAAHVATTAPSHAPRAEVS